MNAEAVPLLIGNDLRVRAFFFISVECERRKTAKLIQSTPIGSERGWTHRRST
jgi:hypothetical protein